MQYPYHILLVTVTVPVTLVAPRAPSPDRQRDMNPLGRALRRVPSSKELRSAALDILEGRTEHLTREELEARGRDMLTSRYAKLAFYSMSLHCTLYM